jgi:hypothetical protein
MASKKKETPKAPKLSAADLKAAKVASKRAWKV